MIENGYGNGSGRGKNIFYCSPLRPESTPSFVVNTKENLWHDFGSGEGGNLINLVQKLNPGWSDHQVLCFLEQQIQDKRLQYNVDYVAKLKAEEEKQLWLEGKRTEREEKLNQETVIDEVVPLTHPYLRDYIIRRRIDYNIAQRYCKEVHYTLRGKRYFAIAFMNVSNGMEARNKFNKRCIGKKSISAIYSQGCRQQHCCVFEGFFDMLTYLTIEAWMNGTGICIEQPCDFYVLNGVGEVKLLLPYLKEYDTIHCYLDNDVPGKTATKMILDKFPDIAIDESYRYKDYNDLNDYLIGTKQNHID